MIQIKHTQICSLTATPAIREQTHPNLYPLAGDDCRLTCSNWAVQTQVALELADTLLVFGGKVGVDFGGGDATKHFSVVKRGL